MGVKGINLLVQILNYFHYLCLLEIKCTDKLSTLRMFTCFEHIIVIISLVITKYFTFSQAKVLSKLSLHPNIISYYDSFEVDGTLMIEMEYADGG